MIAGQPPTLPRVMAVIVLYRRSLADAQPWPTLLRWLDGGDGRPLHRCLVYDSSPEAGATPDGLPAGVELVQDRSNGGTAAGYTTAARASVAHGCDWVLLLDQDTALPADYLERAFAALSRNPDVSVLVPQVRHGDAIISPAAITARGAVRPGSSRPRGATRTAIASGLVVRSDALNAALPFPEGLWLDYVDHWMFRRFADQARSIGDIDAVLAHDLSLRSPAALSRERLTNILDSEAIFYSVHGGGGWIRLRRVARAAHYLVKGHLAHAVVILYRAVRMGRR